MQKSQFDDVRLTQLVSHNDKLTKIHNHIWYIDNTNEYEF